MHDRSIYQPNIVRISKALACCDEVWETAYLGFETPEAEMRKFKTRLERLGVAQWPRDCEVVELFCGRGNGLRVLTTLGFSRIEGLDLSERLLVQYQGPATLYVCDCRQLPFEDSSRDILIVQGGLHHLANLADDLHAVLSEAHRVLRPDGRFVIVEPWLTPFLVLVHGLCRSRVVPRLYRRLRYLAIMIEREGAAYETWLSRPQEILTALTSYYTPELLNIRWGKLMFLGRKPFKLESDSRQAG